MKLKEMRMFIRLLVSGRVEHSYQLSYSVLRKYGLPVTLLADGRYKEALLQGADDEVLSYIPKGNRRIKHG